MRGPGLLTAPALSLVALIHELRGIEILGSSLSLYRMFMHRRSGETPKSPPEYPLRPHILIHDWIDIHCGVQASVASARVRVPHKRGARAGLSLFTNFAFLEFSEVGLPLYGVLGSSYVRCFSEIRQESFKDH